ncbi:sensor histidine kinase [Nannocystis punicea]|uniref:histidine kinase n=1 Tax=Nannocystis punicea TaxID=2995304 RepID=A0ABY7H6B2_9BACT|nr:HAMP domain-containing sensor histidine kinase [Nannocystis poenicansa]WAS94812.1 HAMP domain-containing sensor histidine kinase [Nannocystis poenicansa]
MANADVDTALAERVRELEQRLEAAERARLAAEEEVAELRVELAHTGERGRLAAVHTERLLEGLEVLGEARDVLPLFAEVLRVLGDVLEFDAAFVVGFAPEVSPQIVSATDPRLYAVAWPGGAFTDRVLAGRTVALFDLAGNLEWQQVDPALRGEYASALHVPLHALHSQAMLVCLHRRRGFFIADRITRARRFAALVRQALRTAEQLVDLESDRNHAVALSRAKSRFVAGVSHELRTPVDAIVGYCEHLLEEPAARQGPELAEVLGRIYLSARVLCDLLGNILDLSKIEAGRMDLELGTVAIAETCRLALVTVAPLAARNGNRVRVELAPDLPELRSDAGKLRQILINLLANACKFTEAGTIDLLVRADPGDAPALVFQVRDTGKGLAPEECAALFRPFTQLGLAETRRGGTGLGLTIAKYLTELMGGTIGLDSVVGVGTTFTVRLPLAGST